MFFRNQADNKNVKALCSVKNKKKNYEPLRKNLKLLKDLRRWKFNCKKIRYYSERN